MPINELNATKNEIREQAFLTWYACSFNDSKAMRELAKLGLSISRPTLFAWKKKYCWVERAASIDAKKTQAADAVKSAEEMLIADLMEQKQRYDDYFKSLPLAKVDNQAMFAYGNLCKQIIELTWKKKKNDDEATSSQSEEISINVNFVKAIKRPESADKGQK